MSEQRRIEGAKYGFSEVTWQACQASRELASRQDRAGAAMGRGLDMVEDGEGIAAATSPIRARGKTGRLEGVC